MDSQTVPSVNYYLQIREIARYVPQRFRLMSPYDRRSLKSFGLGSSLFIFLALGRVTVIVTKLPCEGGVSTIVFEGISVAGVCIGLP